MVAVVILAGGKSRRMGRDKLDLAFGGRTLLESVAERFLGVFEDVFLSVADAGKYPSVQLRRIMDIVQGCGPLSGLHSALVSLPCDGVFLVAADLPYACPVAAKRIIELCGEKEACVIRLPDGKLEPLFGFYRKSLLPRCEAALLSGDYRMSELVLGADTQFVVPADLGVAWDERLIMNINSPEDFDKAALELSR